MNYSFNLSIDFDLF